MPHALTLALVNLLLSAALFPQGARAAETATEKAQEKLEVPSDFPRLPFPYSAEQVVRAQNCGGVDLRERIAYWKKKFRIEDWRVGVGCGMVPKYAATHSGLTMWSAHDREAFIWINADKILEVSAATIEACIIHEMLHVAQADELETRQENDIEQFVRTQADLIYEYEWKLKALEAKLARKEKRK